MTGEKQLLMYVGRLSKVADALRKPIALADLAEAVGASQRTVQRDIHFLKSLGAPIVLTLKPYKWRMTRLWSFWNAIQRASRDVSE